MRHKHFVVVSESVGKGMLTGKNFNTSPNILFSSPAIVCPSGEQITNGGFETGDLSGWSYSDASVVTDSPHSGTYHLRFDNPAGWIEQNISNVPVSCVKKFSFWYKRSQSWATTILRIYITYTDNTFTEVVIGGAGSPVNYEEVDLLPELESGKVIKKLRIEQDPFGDWTADIDDISLEC